MMQQSLVFVAVALVMLVFAYVGFRLLKNRRKAPLISTQPVAPEIATVSEPLPLSVQASPVVGVPKAPKPSLNAALSKTKKGWVARLSEVLSVGSKDKGLVFEQVEEVLFSADIGVKTSARLLEIVKDNLSSSDPHEIQLRVAQAITDILRAAERAPIYKNGTPGPKVIMFVGVNGVGKTTSIGKLATQFTSDGNKVVLGAGDTFRAAAAEQLEVWAERSKSSIVRGLEQADPASVLFDAINKAKHENADFVLCDTAGRLHTKTNLMEELQKVHRVMGKACEGAPHEVLLVVDATTGQNAIEQARQFMAAAPLTGVILTKLDGTAKGGVVIGIADELKIPIRYIGIGEGAADLRPFDADEFVKALFSKEDNTHA